MSITIDRYTFEGPFPLTATRQLKNASGVYAILTVSKSRGYVDIGESDDVRERVETHDRRPCWESNKKGDLFVAALYCGEADRLRIEKELRAALDPVCGDR